MKLFHRNEGAALTARVVGTPTQLTHEAIARAVAIDDERLRNHQVTLGYSKLAHALRNRVGGGANWCTWATWASRTVGHALDPHEPPYLLDQRTRRWPGWARATALTAARLSRSVLNPLMAPAIAIGNREIYDEIADHFVDLLSALEAGTVADRRADEIFVASLKPAEYGDPEIDRRFDNYREGFLHYLAAARETDPRRRTQLVLAANLRITDYEQMRLQRYVERAFFLAPRDGFDLRSLLRRVAGPMVARITTRSVTAIITPRIVIPVGEGLRPLPNASTLVPAELVEPIEELADALNAYPSGSRPRARNWADFPDRMSYITGLFRAYHFEPSLYEPPFTDSGRKLLELALWQKQVGEGLADNVE